MEHVHADALAAVVTRIKAGDVDLGGYVDIDTCACFDPKGRWMNEACIVQVLEELDLTAGTPTHQT